MQENNNLPKLTEQLVNINQQDNINPVDYVYNSIKIKADSSNSLLNQIDAVKDDANYFSDIFNSAQEPQKTSFNEDRINVNEAYTRLSDGTYITRYDNGFIKGADNEEIYANQQSNLSKWTNGLTKFVGKTATNVVGGTFGTAYGAISAISQGNWEKIYDNDFYDFLDDQNTKMDNFVANYRTQEERDSGFFSSLGTANFWADDFLGGLSFLSGTVISESLWATATGGASLSTTAARVGLRGSKYFNTAKGLLKGVKQAQRVARKYNRLSSIKKATSLATKYGKAGQLLNTARFTYTGAGFEAGMEARLYQKEQRENFYRDFESLNGRKPSSEEIADFENNLGETANTLWAANMALVGTSNLAILGKTFGVTSPFKSSSKTLDKALFGKGVKTVFGEAGERLQTEAIKRTKLQKGLGFGKSILKGPFFEGFVEEGGQSTFSSAMENYLTSRYNPSEDAVGLIESMYEGLSHTYGTKEGWKEVGLGVLIGLVGGEGSNVLSGQSLFSEARQALQDEDFESVQQAERQNKHTGSKTVDRIFATRFEENLKKATDIQNAEKDYAEAEKRGDVMGMATSQTRVMLSSIVSSVNMDYFEDQVSDFETALKLKEKSEIAEHYGIEEDQVDSKIAELVSNYKQIGDNYKSARDFSDYIISDNPKELFEDATDINVEDARSAIAYQLVMTDVIENHAEEAYSSLMDSLAELSPTLSSEYAQALTKYNQINRSKKQDIIALSKVENKLKLKKEQLSALNKRLLKFDQTKISEDTQKNQKNADSYNKITNKISEIELEIQDLNKELTEKNNNLETIKTERSRLKTSIQSLANQLDSVDPLSEGDFIDQITIEETQNKLEELDKSLLELSKTKPQLVERVVRLGKEYRNGLELWKRNADTIEDLINPDIGLNRIGTLLQRKRKAGSSTVDLLRRLQKTQVEELEFSNKLENLLNSENSSDSVVSQNDLNEQEAADNNQGEDVLNSQNQTENINTDDSLSQLKKSLKDLVGKNSFLLDNFTNDANELAESKAPTQEDLNTYNSIRNKFLSGDINSLIGRPVDQISKRVKERSGLSDEEIVKYQDLSQKFLDWRIVLGTNSNGVSIKDILDQIQAYEQEVDQIRVKITTEQVLEMSEQGQSDFSVDKGNPDFVNSMDKVNIARDKIQTTISHLDISTIQNSDFNVTYLREDNRGTEENPDMAFVYELEKDGNSFEIQYTKDHHRTIISNKNTPSFLEGMGMKTVKYNTKTGWGYVFKDGIPMESDFGINLINNPDVNILNSQEIYNLNPGDKVYFSVNMKDIYNSNTIIPLLNSGQIEEASKLMSIYVVNNNGDVLGFLKSGFKGGESNFDKVRKEAVKQLQDKVKNTEVTLLDLASDNTNSIINLPFEVEVEKTFIGTPNIELDDQGNAKSFKITPEQSDLILGFGFSKNGNISEENDVRKTFIPKKGNTPYVVIEHLNTKVAFPVSLSLTNSNIAESINNIINSDLREPEKVTEVIKILKTNGIEPSSFNINSVSETSVDLSKLVESLASVKRPFSEKEILNMSKEEFISSSEILINLDKPAFVSPKVKVSLSKNLKNTLTDENTKTNSLTRKERTDLIVQHLTYLSKAKNEDEVNSLVFETGDDVFIKEFTENSKFKSEVVKAAISSSPVPFIYTRQSLAEVFKDVIDTDFTQMPLGIDEKFRGDLIDLVTTPTEDKIARLVDKVLPTLENVYKITDIKDTNNLYFISTSESEDKLFDKGYVKYSGDFYKKVDNKYNLDQLLEGLYEQYNSGTLPPHISLEEDLSIERFKFLMPSTLLDVYKLYYNSQEELLITKKSLLLGNDQYLREEFKGEFDSFIQSEKIKGSELYKKVLQHFQITDKGIIKDDLLTRDKIDEFKTELGDIYSNLLNYSLINKHIELQATPQNIIFVEDIENTKRLEAINSSNLFQPKSKANVIDEKTISFSKINDDFIQYEGDVYEQVYTDNQGNYVYERISKIDPNFIITDVTAPFNTTVINKQKQLDDTTTTIKTTERGAGLDC